MQVSYLLRPKCIFQKLSKHSPTIHISDRVVSKDFKQTRLHYSINEVCVS